MDLVFNIQDSSPVVAENKDSIIIIRESDNLPNNRKTLDALIKAIKLTDDDYILHVLHEEQKPVIPLQSKKAILFGLGSQLSNIDLPDNQIVNFEQCHLISTQTLSELNANPKLKMALWESLQRLYLKK